MIKSRLETRPCLKDIINNLKKPDTWKIELTTATKFMSSNNNEPECIMHLKGDNIEIMTNDKED